MTQFKHPFNDSLAKISNRLEYLIKQTELKSKQPEDMVLFDNSDIQKLLNISSKTAANWRDEGILPYSQVKNKFYYKLSDIRQLIDKHYRPGKKKY